MVKSLSNSFAFVLLIVTSFYAADSNQCAGDWSSYKDEKCYKIVDDTLRTYEDAATNCTKLDATPALIHSEEEQNFLTTFLFKTSKKVDNFWIGAKYQSTAFKWSDNSELTFTNWDAHAPKNRSNYCVQMQSEESLLGKWMDEPCEKKNLVVCQKAPTWSLAQLQKTVLTDRKQLNNEIEDLRKQLNELKQNPIPLGFIYTQIPNSPAPSEIWASSITWTDVSENYAGVFFRISGGQADSFGRIQEDNSPHLSSAEYVPSGSTEHTNFSRGQCSTVDAAGKLGTWSSLKFCLSGGEVRPRNMAIRVWKRTG